MDKNKKNIGLGKAISFSLIGTAIGRTVNHKVQIVMLIGLLIYMIIYTIILVKKKTNVPHFIYIGTFGTIIGYLIYLTNNVYSIFGKSIQEWLLVLVFIPGVYFFTRGSISIRVTRGKVRKLHP